ncbi:ketopantoate reductase family protein [Shewanella acanthi]|uniref:ketopantoate reductase family protein n=1 Tax=Shewanella acanthi TaxID=2864212 RepID=UPI001C654E83|nr:2-dehydropantoate 2-reductase [Shewanella acanthi]QYJ79492.1 2-dehydropantoate 2-reductase [Shewanella acanthi]
MQSHREHDSQLGLGSPDIAILGAGAVGQLICHQLWASGISVGFLAREPSTHLWQTLSFSTTCSASPSTLAEQYRVPIIATDSDSLAKLRLLIVCVKAYQVMEAVTPFLETLPKDCHILLLHNGMGPHLALEPLLDGRGLSLGTTSQGVLRQSTWQITQTGQGLTQLGHFTGPELEIGLSKALIAAIPNSEWVEAIIPCLWQKLAVNAAINPLTAINQCTNGKLAEAQFSAMITDILDELHWVAEHDGILLDKSYLQQRVYQVIQLTAENFSSMHQDVAHKRRTEIDQINGYICERARVHNLSAPTNEKVWQQIKQLEAKY